MPLHLAHACLLNSYPSRKVEPLVIPVLVATSPGSGNYRAHRILGAGLTVGFGQGRGVAREECLVQEPAQHNHLLPRDFPFRLARAREERARFVSPLLARFRGSYPCRARSPPSSAAPLAQPSHASLSMLRSPLCPPANAWAERESPAPESSHWHAGYQIPAARSGARSACSGASLQDPRTRRTSPGAVGCRRGRPSGPAPQVPI